MRPIARSHSLPLPRGWPRRVRSAVVQVLARTSLAFIRAGQNAALNFDEPVQLLTSAGLLVLGAWLFNSEYVLEQ